MGDHAVSDSTFSSYEEHQVSPTDSSIPPTVLARWAALASARACFGVIPRQVELKA